MSEEKIKMICPKCDDEKFISSKYAYREKIDGVKCSLCFRERSTFVNLEIAPIENRFEILDL